VHTVRDGGTNFKDTCIGVTRGPSVLVVRCTCHLLWLNCRCGECGECGRLMMSVVRTRHNSYIHSGLNAKFMNADTPF
jgi:hypothetical protein